MNRTLLLAFSITTLMSFNAFGSDLLKETLNKKPSTVLTLARASKGKPRVISLSSLDPKKEEEIKEREGKVLAKFKELGFGKLTPNFEEDPRGKQREYVRECFEKLLNIVHIEEATAQNSLICWLNEDIDGMLWNPAKWFEFKGLEEFKFVDAQTQCDLIGVGLSTILRVEYNIALQGFHGGHEEKMKMPSKENLDHWIKVNVAAPLQGGEWGCLRKSPPLRK